MYYFATEKMNQPTTTHKTPYCQTKVQTQANPRSGPAARRPQHRQSRSLAAASKGKQGRAGNSAPKSTQKRAATRASRGNPLDISKSTEISTSDTSAAVCLASPPYCESAAVSKERSNVPLTPTRRLNSLQQLKPDDLSSSAKEVKETEEAAPASSLSASAFSTLLSPTQILQATGLHGGITTQSVTSGPGSGDDREVLRTEMSRKGLSVHAAPFLPLSRTAPQSPALAQATCEHGVPLFPCEGSKRYIDSIVSPCSVEDVRAQSHSLEFPCTPLVLRGGMVYHPPGFRGGGALATSESCLSPDTPKVGSTSSIIPASVKPVTSSPTFDTLRCQQCVQCGDGKDDSVEDIPYTTEGVEDSCEGDGIRHLRIPFTDAEAQDEAKMLHMLQMSEEEEDAASVGQEWQECIFGSSNAGASNVELFHCAGGYWDVNGPSVATRRLLRHRMPSSSSLNIDAQGDEFSSVLASQSEYSADHGHFAYDNDDGSWEMSSSAYADSLDDEQLEWIEQHLRAK